MKKPKEGKAIIEARKFVEDFPDSYNAHRDSLTSPHEHMDTVNKLLQHLRAVLEECRYVPHEKI